MAKQIEQEADAECAAEPDDDAHELVDPLAGVAEDVASASEKALRDPAPAAAADSKGGATDDIDAIVRAAKAVRDGTGKPVAPPAIAKVCLIVDDSRVIRKVSSKIARSLGYFPIEAQDGNEALARCKKSMPDLVLTDWNMPEMDGLEFVEKLRAIPTPKPPVVVFCTSKGETADIHDGIKAGADDYIVKPFNEDALRAKLEKVSRL